MEENRHPRRSQSHGSLRSNYSRNTRPAHKPLSKVNENSSLLSSSAALGGMLKTTTETGDIGLYSIQSVPGTALGTPSRARNTAGRRFPSRHPPRRSADESRRFGGHGRFPPVSRDATSEIISMYGSNSQSSVTSTRATSHDEPGQRSFSMTTAGSRQLSHNKSNTTLQSQASSGPLQRPRSPFPYPTRLPRPGARPVSPAVTEAGIVDYSRMVEIDRISLRTGNGPYKSAYQPVHRRPPPGVRPDGHPSMHSLHAPPIHGQMPPPMRRAPGPPSVRTASAASIASWNTNTSFRGRVNNSASRTSSLTSVVDMYYRMPPAVRATQLGPAPSPRYYDYTEEFESKRPGTSTTLEPVSPIPTRASNRQYPLVLREGSEEQLANVFSAEVESAFDKDDSQFEDSQAETESHLLSDVDLAQESSTQVQEPARVEAPYVTASDKEQNVSDLARERLGSRKLTRGSDIDLLPSQIGRASVDTFRPSFDVESKSVPPFNYPKFRQSVSQQTNTPSPAQQVQVHGGKTRSIKSEQGVILQSNPANYATAGEQDEHEEYRASPKIAAEAMILPQSSSKAYSRSGPTSSQFNKGTQFDKALEQHQRQIIGTDSSGLDNHTVETQPQSQKTTQSLNEEISGRSPKGTVLHTKLPLPFKISGGLSQSSQQQLFRDRNKTFVSDNDELRGMKVNRTNGNPPNNSREFESVTDGSIPGNGNDTPLTPSCSLAPLVAPQPISPSRELRVRNSIPQLMKALPPLPGQPGYVPPSPPTTPDDDQFTQILKPYTSLDNLKTSGKVKVQSSMLTKPLPDIQKRLPKIRIKPKGAVSEAKQTYRESRPWNSDSNYPWCAEAPEIELADIRTERSSRATLQQKLRLRGSRTVCGGTPVGTVRRKPEAQQQEPIGVIVDEQPKDLFSVPSGLADVFRQVSRKFSQGSANTTIKHSKAQFSSIKKSSLLGIRRTRSRSTVTLEVANHRNISGRSSEGQVISKQQHRGLGKRLSDLRWRLARDKHVKTNDETVERTEFLHGKRQAGLDSTFGLGSIDSERKAIITPAEGIVSEAEDGRVQFKRRMKKRISKWMRGTKSVLKHN